MAATPRGHIEQLPSGSFRVHVYAGTDPVTGKPRRIRETCPDDATAAATLGRLLAEVDQERFPDRDATLGHALDKYLEVADLEVSTREAHEGYIRRTIKPVLGQVKIRKLGADSLDSLYAALKRCSRLCGRLPRTEHHADSTDGAHQCDHRCGPLRDHRTNRPHECDQRCGLHACKPMKPATILRIHSIISSALDLAVRYDWVGRNVARNASPPHPRKREPDPPTPEQAARLLNLVFADDEEFGLYLWLSFTTGGRRGEMTGLREHRFDFARQRLRLADNYLVKQGQHIEKPPKDGDGRWVSLDPLTCELFADWFGRRRHNAEDLAVAVPRAAYAFSPEPDGSTPWNPDTMTHRYRRYARRVGITSSLKELRHYSATELLHAGVDLNTVAGRLGHAEGSTTLKFYAQFTASADQRAAIIIPSQLDALRKRERLRELYREAPAADLGHLAATLAPVAGLEPETALNMLTELAAEVSGTS
jgi:integrase